MLYKNISKYILGISLFVILVIGGYYFINRDLQNPTENLADEKKGDVVNDETGIQEKFRNAIDANDFKTVASLLKTLYENDWIKKKEFNELEKEVYVKVDKTYFTPGNFEKSLEITKLIHDQAPLSGRFRYLFILSLEALGKKALAEKNYSKAEEYAMRILQIMYRQEGVNLLADIYIEKIRNKIKAGDKQGALNDWNYIMEFELTDEKRKILSSLRDKLK